MSDSTKYALDAIDACILMALQDDARTPNIALAEHIGLSPSPCSRRVKSLEDHGVIEGYRTQISRSEEHTSELQSLMRISYAVFCLKKKTTATQHKNNIYKK